MKKGFVVLLMLLALSGCGQRVADPDAQAATSIVIKGSDTLLPLVAPWAETYMNAHPEVEISVTGGGSGTGIAALINGSTDICMASRDMSAEEKQTAGEKKVTPRETPVARDGIAIVVHPANPLGELTMAQLHDIYTGVAVNWKDVGGSDAAIMAYSRESSSGTFVFFQEHVLQKQDYATSVRLMPATSSIIQAVQSEAGAIGYVGLGHAHEAGGQVKIIAVRAAAGAAAVAASESTVLDGSYPIARALYFYTSDAVAAPTQAFMDYCLSAAGQTMAREAGFVPLQ